MADHIHILFGFRPTQSLSALMQEVKRDSSEWINQNKFVKGKFTWQEGYGAFSYSKSQISNVANYIENQEKHHVKRTFIEEYRKILDDFGIDYDKRYIFHEIEQDASLQDAIDDITHSSTERSIPNGMQKRFPVCNTTKQNINRMQEDFPVCNITKPSIPDEMQEDE
jgi:hypothetical protein